MREKQSDKQGLIDLVNSTRKSNLVMLEIGSFAGESAEIFINTGKVDKIICVDPWMFEDHGDGNSYSNIAWAEQVFDKVVSRHPDKMIKFKGILDTFLTSDLFKEYRGKIDLVYIDGLHTYEGCLHDIVRTMAVVRPNVAISGHDYATDVPHVQGVKRAVNDYFNYPHMTFVDTSWIRFL